MDTSSLYCIVGSIVSLICGLIAGSICSSKGRSYLEGFLFGAFLAIVGIIIAAVLPENKRELENKKVTEGIYKKCPYCAELIKAEAIVCRYCSRDLPQVESMSVEGKKGDRSDSYVPNPMNKPCPNCGKSLLRNTNTCSYCEHPVPDEFWSTAN